MKELQDKLIELTLKYLEFENPNYEQNSALHKIKEVRKSLDCLNVSLSTDEIEEYFNLKQDRQAFIRYIKNKEEEHNISLFNFNTDGRDFYREALKAGFSGKYIIGETIVQLVEFYIKNHNGK